MILDRLENAGFYRSLGPRIRLALDYLGRTDFAQVPEGRYELDGADLFAIVQRYATKPVEAARWEAHRNYTDVQYVVEGMERMGYTPLRNGLAEQQAYDPQTDSVFYQASGDLFNVTAGQFALFTPQDIHAPGLTGDAAGQPQPVCKVVMKCRVGDS
jgi:YhcH/YjgK/YiaL family protein